MVNQITSHTPWSRIAFRVNESAANTLTEAQFRTPSVPEQMLGLQIRRTELQVPQADSPILTPGGRAASTLAVSLHLRQGLTTFPAAQTAGTIHHVVRTAQSVSQVQVGAEGVTASSTETIEGETAIDWAPSEGAGGLIIATAVLSLYIQGGSQAGAKFAVVNVYYRLVRLNQQQLIAAISLSDTF